MNYPILLLFGIAPSLIWLAFYLRKDAHPEPNSMILKVFVWGALATIPVLFIELGAKAFLRDLALPEGTSLLIYTFIGIALVEEIAKFLVVRWKVFSNSALDEPVDLMLYMIIAALGFAALENMFILWGLGPDARLQDVAVLSAVRFVGATFLHALASGLFGFFIALSYLSVQKHSWYVFLAVVLTTLLHGVFNFLIISAEGVVRFGVLFAIFLATALFISFAITKLKQIKSVCVL